MWGFAERSLSSFLSKSWQAYNNKKGNVCSFRPAASSCPIRLFHIQHRRCVEQDADIFSLPSPPLFVSGIPLTHHSSSHLPPLPPVSPYLSSSVLTFLSFQHVSLCVFLSLRVCSFLSSPPTLSSSPKLYLVLGPVAVTTLTHSLDTVLALAALFLLFFSFTVLPLSLAAFRHLM